MSKKSTAGNRSRGPKRRYAAATLAQILRQSAVIIVVAALWSALLVGYLALTAPGREPATTPQPTAAEVAPSVDSTTTAPSPTPEPAAEGRHVSFSADVLPILEANCQRCHGATRASAGLSLTSYASVMAGSNSGPIVIPGSAETSHLVQVIITGQMPRGASKLPDAEIQTISNWVDAGAPDD